MADLFKEHILRKFKNLFINHKLLYPCFPMFYVIVQICFYKKANQRSIEPTIKQFLLIQERSMKVYDHKPLHVLFNASESSMFFKTFCYEMQNNNRKTQIKIKKNVSLSLIQS